jgi:trk system potassium uptake protein TrkH
MALNRKPILKVLFVVTALIGGTMLIPLLVCLIYREFPAAKAFALCAIPMMAVGITGERLIPKINSNEIRIREGFFIVGFSWLLMSLLGALPFVIAGEIPSVVDAYFEMASGFTTTGSTILTDIEALSKGMLFWRSFTHWLGGMGILVLTIALLPVLGIGGQRIMRAETTGPTMDKISFTINDSARRLYLTYAGMTILEVLLLCLGGMSLYDSLVQTFGTVGTGGFSCYADSVGAFHSPYAEYVIGIFMMLAGINFSLHYTAVTGGMTGLKAMLKDSELRFYVGTIGVSTLFITVMLLVKNFTSSVEEAFRLSFFEVSSIITTTGYGTADSDLWPLSVKMLLLLLMLMGGCAGSTGGGMKVIRVMIGLKAVKRAFAQRLHPKAVMPVRIGRKPIPESTISSVMAFIVLYMLTLGISIFIISFEDVSFMTALSSVVACVSNIGPGFDAVGATGNFAFFSDFSKILLSVLMIAGRLELFTIFLLFTPRFWSSDK